MFIDNLMLFFNYFHTLDPELIYVTVATEESDLESANWLASTDNYQTMDFQVKFELFLQL